MTGWGETERPGDGTTAGAAGVERSEAVAAGIYSSRMKEPR